MAKKPIDKAEFLTIVNASRDIAEAARKMGISSQSVRARLDRMRIRNFEQSKALRHIHSMSDADLEKAWHDANDEMNVSMADDLFGEMCNRMVVKHKLDNLDGRNP